MDEGFVAGMRAETSHQERMEVYAALQKVKWSFIDKKSEGMKHRTEWCAEKSIDV